jgi:hypothetical protein
MADCAVCGKYVSDNNWGTISNNVRGPRRYLHDQCRSRLIAERNRSDGFPCPHCKTEFTPDSFPFDYTYVQGGMGDAGNWTLKDQVCPHCHAPLAADLFRVCKLCGGGAARGPAVEVFESSTAVSYHDACSPASRRRIAAALSPPEKKSGWLSWLS